jgi:hypothetical protein
MDNVESAEAAGDHYPTTRVLTADGVVSLIGALMGNPFINAVYIGHPGWKAMGGRIGYSAATGAMVIVLAWMGVISLPISCPWSRSCRSCSTSACWSARRHFRPRPQVTLRRSCWR